jgi:hypothetical protein
VPRPLPAALAALALLLFLTAGPAGAQGLPPYRPINPIIASRSALGFEPVLSGVGWLTTARLDYGSIVELRENRPAFYLLDAEISRIELGVTRFLGERWVLQVTVPVQSAHAGFLDAPVRWWHGLLGVQEQNRDTRPDNEFAWEIHLPDGQQLEFERSGTTLGDTRVLLGFRHTPDWQTALVLGLPTATAAPIYRTGTVATGLITTFRREVPGDRLLIEGSAGLGWTPRHGELRDWQRRVFYSASGGARVRVVGRQSVYANVFFHSAAFAGTTLRTLDREDLSLDLGFLFRIRNGPEILVGLVEDLYVYGPAVDLVLRFGVSW